MAANAVYNALDNFGLHHFALLGDDEGVRRALREGADINAFDPVGRTAVMCAVAGENWQNIDACDASFMSTKRINTLKALLRHPDVSLLTLNAPHPSMNGVIPLCMAAWLNLPQAVRVLLDDSVDTISVDGMDSHGATALMYAARDGNLEVVQTLLTHGARPDFRDRNHRTSIQFSLSHPQILWLCESVLRRHRWRESKSADRTRLSADTENLVDLTNSSINHLEDLQPPPLSIFTPEATARLTSTLISCIRQADLSFIHSLLFAPAVDPSSPPAQYPMSVPALVNIPDSKGWSLVHHCVAVPQPSIDILDALYCAGADVSLFTVHEKHTPLHILARCAQVSHENPDTTHSLHDFCLHLIQDLRAPLSARDEDDETCIHIAAEHGHSPDLLMLFLHCDTTGAIRKMKNSRGLTPVEVAKTEFLYVFGIENNGPRSSSALSNRTVRPTDSFASLSSISDLNAFTPPTTHDSSSVFSPAEIDIDFTVHQLLSNLRATSLSVSHPATNTHIQELEYLVDDATEQCNSIVIHFRGRIEEAAKVVQDLHKTAERIESIRNGVVVATNGKLLLRGITPVQSRKRNRDSEDSQLTYVDQDDIAFDFPVPPRLPLPTNSAYISTGTQTSFLDLYVSESAMSRSASILLDHFTPPTSPTSSAQMSCLWEIERELKELELQSAPSSNAGDSPTKGGMKLKHVMKKRKKLEDKLQDLEWNIQAQKKDALSGTSRIKAWLKRMVIPHQQAPKQQIVHDLGGECNVGHEVKTQHSAASPDADAFIDSALRTSKVVLEAAHRDLISIDECLESAEKFIDLANHSISRTQRVVKRAIKKREQMIADLRAAAHNNKSTLSRQGELSPSLLGYEHGITLRTSMASISTIYSVSSSASSVAATLTENDDEDIRIIRRLLLRKIEAQTSGAWDEVDKVMGWLQIVKEAVRSVKRRAYL